jgi:hypothetical protein
MKFQFIEEKDTKDGCPYLCIGYPHWSHHPHNVYYAIRNGNSYSHIEQYEFGRFHPREYITQEIDTFQLIPFHEQRMLTQILRQITGDETFECNWLTYPEHMITRF